MAWDKLKSAGGMVYSELWIFLLYRANNNGQRGNSGNPNCGVLKVWGNTG